MTSKVFFDSIKEKHGTFFVEYRPPLHDFLFATLHLTYLYDMQPEQIRADLEKHARKWVDRYPVSLMASAFDDHGRVIDLKSADRKSYLIALKNDSSFEMHWKPVPDSAFPSEALDTEYLLSIYSDIKYRTQEEIKQSAIKSLKPMRRLKVLILVWAVFIPALITILGFFSPAWVAVVALIYSLWQAYQKYLLLTGRKKKSAAEFETEREELRMKHHHYHCEKNPDGFIRLRNENFRAEAMARIKNEFEALP